MAGLEKRNRGVVIDMLGVHRANKAQVIRHFGRVGEKVTDPSATLPMLRKREQRTG